MLYCLKDLYSPAFYKFNAKSDYRAMAFVHANNHFLGYYVYDSLDNVLVVAGRPSDVDSFVSTHPEYHYKSVEEYSL